MSGGTSLRVGASEVARKTQAVTLTDPVTGEQVALSVDTTDLETVIGELTETAPATDTASSGLNGRLQRIAQRITSLIALVPASLGAKTAAASFSVTTATDDLLYTSAGAITDNPAADPDADGSIIAKLGGMWNSLVTAVTHLSAIETAVESTADVPTYGVIQYVEVTLTTDTAAYASGDVIADTQIVAAAVRANDAKGVLHSVTIIDQDDQKALLYIYLLSANVSMGTENSAPSISDANALEILGPPVAIAVADYYDLGGVSIAGKDAIGKVVKPATGTDDLYVAVVNGTGTPTYTASGLKLRLGFLS